MIYTINGIGAEQVYSKSGDTLRFAYDISGMQLLSGNSYSNYQITNMWNALNQGMDIHGDVMAWWQESTQSVLLRDLDTGTVLATLATGLSGVHGNDISFTDEFYEVTDEFPLLCIESTYFYRVTRNSITPIKTITYEMNGYNLHYGSAFVGNYMYTIGYRYEYSYQSGNHIRMIKLDMSDLTDNGDDTYTPALLDTVDRDWLECIQGVAYHDGMIWIACGIGGNAGHVYGLNPFSGEIVVDINLTSTGELEGLAWAYNENDGWYAVVGQVGIGFRKITFS